MKRGWAVLFAPIILLLVASPASPQAPESLLFVRMPDETPLPHVPEASEIAEHVSRYKPYLYLSSQDLTSRPALARQVLGQVGILKELEKFRTEHGIPVKVQFVEWNDAFRYFTDYITNPTNPPLVAQLGDTWAAFFRSRGVLPYERRFTWDVRVLWYWKDLVNPSGIDRADFLELCREVRRDAPPEIIAPLAIPTAPTWDLLHDLSIWLYNAGVRSLVSSTKLGLFEWKEAVFAGPEGERAVEFLIRLAEHGVVAFPEKTSGDLAEDFVARQYAMLIMGPSPVVGRAEAALGPDWQSRIGATLPPAIGAESATTVKGGSLLVVLDPSRGANLSGSARGELLVDFLTSEESQQRYVRDSTGDLPGNPEVLSLAPYFDMVSEALEKGTQYPEIPEWAPVVENLVTRDNLYAFWKRLAALAESRMSGVESERQTREKHILAALQSAQIEINRELSHGKFVSLWPWLLAIILVLGTATSVSVWRRRVERERAKEMAEKQRQELAHVARRVTMGELAASLAHELNQPLTAVVSNAQAARRLLSGAPPDTNEGMRALDDIVREGRRAGQVIRTLRTLLRKGDFSLKAVDVNELIREIIALLHGQAIMKNIHLELELDPALPRVSGDRIQLQQAVLNLILNASEAMEHMGSESRHLIVRTARDNGVVEVAVQDSGIGLEEESKERMFDAFFTTKPQGLGMGLSINRTIIEAHGGRLWATPNPNRGATFHFTLPISPDDV